MSSVILWFVIFSGLSYYRRGMPIAYKRTESYCQLVSYSYVINFHLPKNFHLQKSDTICIYLESIHVYKLHESVLFSEKFKVKKMPKGYLFHFLTTMHNAPLSDGSLTFPMWLACLTPIEIRSQSWSSVVIEWQCFFIQSHAPPIRNSQI